MVFLKDRSKKQSLEEREWYERAFGAKQNMMTVRIIFKPLNKVSLKTGKCDIWANIKYKMFPEMEGEFDKADYPDKMVLIDGEEEENGHWEYESEFEYPFGTFNIEIFYSTPKG